MRNEESGSALILILGIAASLGAIILVYSDRSAVIQKDYSKIKTLQTAQIIETNLQQALSLPIIVTQSLNNVASNGTLAAACIALPGPTPLPLPDPSFTTNNDFQLVMPGTGEVMSGGSAATTSVGYDMDGNHCELFAAMEGCIIQSWTWVSQCGPNGAGAIDFEISYSVRFANSGIPSPNPFSGAAPNFTMQPLTNSNAAYARYTISSNAGVYSAILQPAGGPSPSPTPGLIGCYQDSDTPRDLSGSYEQNQPNMTPAVCIAFCTSQSYKYAGVQYSNQCFCGNTYGTYGLYSPAGNYCNAPCSGNAAFTCGGYYANDIYPTGL